MSASVKAPPDPVSIYRDDGPLARALGRVFGAALPLPGAVLALAALAAVVGVAAIAGTDVSKLAVTAVLAWVLVAGGASRGSRRRPRLRWAEPALVRATEYIALIWIAGVHGVSAYPAAYALLAALTFRHYDLVYRQRFGGMETARWVDALSGGWDGRLVLAWVLLVASALPAGFYVLAGLFGVTFVGEAVYAWAVIGRGGHVFPEDEEGNEL
jgi:hypothetical protein